MPALACRDPHGRGFIWFYGFGAESGAWEAVVVERTGTRSIGRFAEIDEALHRWRAAMDCPADIALPEGWTWDRVLDERARWGIGAEMVPVASVPGTAVAWGHVAFERKHGRSPVARAA